MSSKTINANPKVAAIIKKKSKEEQLLEALEQARAEGAESTELAGLDTSNMVAAAPAATATDAAVSSTTGGAAASTAAAGTTAAVSTGVVVSSIAGVAIVAAASGGASSSNLSSATQDTTAPTATITLSDSALKKGETATVTVTFSEAVTGFSNADLTLTSGALSDMSSSDGGKTWTGTFTPTADVEDATNVVSLATTYTDAAGNTGTTATSANYAVDTKTPLIQSLSANGTAKTVTLTYSETLDATNIPATTAFAIQVNGVDNAVTQVVANGATLVLTLANAFTTGQTVSVTYTDAVGDGTTTIQDAAGNDAVSFSSGIVADGYIRDAQMFLDAPSGLVELVGVKTDANGNFFMPAGSNPNGYALVAVGGVNIDTGLPNTTQMKAPAGSTTINPLTTLVQAVVEQAASQGQTITATQAATNVATALGLTLPEGKTLTNYDPLSATDGGAVAAQQAAAQIATLTTLAAEAATSGGGQAAATSVLTNIANVVANNASVGDSSQTVSLADTSVLNQALSGVTLSETQQAAIVEANTAIAAATNITAISTAQSQFVDKIAPDAPTTLTIASLTQDNTPSIEVGLDTTSLNGKAAVTGDTLVILDGNNEVATVVITAAHLAAGKVVVDLAALSDGSHSLTAKLTDKAGNTSAVSSPSSVVVDTTAPTVVLTSATDNLAAGASTTLTMTFSGAVTGLTATDLQVTGGAISNLVKVSDTVYTATYTAPTTGGAGSVQISAGSYTDAAGNTGAVSNALDLAVVNPPVVTINSIGGNDKVISAQTGDNVISGTAQNNIGDVIVKAGDVTLGTATVTNGTWSYTLTSENLVTIGQGGRQSITAEQTRTVGENSYTGSDSTYFSVDTLAPSTTLSVSGLSDSDTVINAAEKSSGVAVTGTAEAGVKVELTVAGGTKVVTANGEGAWSYLLTNADYKAFATTQSPSISAVAIDAAGNKSAAVTKTFAIDTVAPTIGLVKLSDSTDTGMKGDGRTSHKTPSIEFAAENAAAIWLAVDDVPYALQTTVTGKGLEKENVQTLAIGSELSEGVHTIKLKAVDAAGNESVRTTSIVIDSTAPSITNSASNVAENAGDNKVVYKPTTTDASVVSYALKAVDDVSSFTIDTKTGEVTLKNSANFEAKSSYTFTVVATDAAGNPSEKAVTLSVTDVNEAPTAVTLNGSTATLAENTNTANPIKVANITVADDALGKNSVTLTGADAANFEVGDDRGLYLKAGVQLDFETKAQYDVTVNVADNTLTGSTPVTANYSLSVSDVNEAPTAVTLNNKLATVAENTILSARMKVADIAITDDALGEETITLIGSDAERFEVVDGALYLKANTALDFEVKPTYEVAVAVADQSLAGSTVVHATSNYSLAVTNVNEAPIASRYYDAAKTIVNGQALPLDATFVPDFVDPENDNLTFSISSGTTPPGLSFNNGVVTGTPTTDGSYTFTVTASDGSLTYAQEYTVSVVSAPVVQSMSIADAEGNTGTGKQGDFLIITLNLSEAVTLSGSAAPTIILGGAKDPITANFTGLSSDGKALMFSAIAPAGNTNTLTLQTLNLNGATITGQVTGVDLMSTVNGLNASYALDNTPPADAAISLGGSDSVLNATEATSATPVTITPEAGATIASVMVDGTSLTASNNAYTFDAAPLSQGQHSVTVVTQDAAGNTKTTTKAFSVDTLAPQISSGNTANSIAENSGADQIIYKAASDDTTAKYSLKATGDAALLTIDVNSGDVKLLANPNYEAKPSYSFTVVATDAAGNASEKAVVLNITDIDEAVTPGGSTLTLDLTKPSMTLVSSNIDGSAATTTSLPFDMLDASSDGRYVLFSSGSQMVTAPSQSLSNLDVFMKDMQTGTITVVSQVGATETAGSSYGASISSDGRYVAFVSNANNLAGSNDSTNGLYDAYVKDMQTGDISLVSTSVDSNGLNKAVDNVWISNDGTKVLFRTSATDAIAGHPTSDLKFHLYVKNLSTGTLDRISALDGSVADQNANNPVFSADGRYVLFNSSATNLIANDTNALQDAFRYDIAGKTVERVAEGVSSRSNISADGGAIIYTVSNITTSEVDLYFKDMVTGAVEVLATNIVSSHPIFFLGSDTRYIAFSSGRNLIAEDTNQWDISGSGTMANVVDVYVKDRLTGELHLISKTPDGLLDMETTIRGVSPDGTKLYVQSYAGNLPGADSAANYTPSVYEIALGGVVSNTIDLATLMASVSGHLIMYAPSSATGAKVVVDLNVVDANPSVTSYFGWDNNVTKEARSITVNLDANNKPTGFTITHSNGATETKTVKFINETSHTITVESTLKSVDNIEYKTTEVLTYVSANSALPTDYANLVALAQTQEIPVNMATLMGSDSDVYFYQTTAGATQRTEVVKLSLAGNKLIQLVEEGSSRSQLDADIVTKDLVNGRLDTDYNRTDTQASDAKYELVKKLSDTDYLFKLSRVDQSGKALAETYTVMQYAANFDSLSESAKGLVNHYGLNVTPLSSWTDVFADNMPTQFFMYETDVSTAPDKLQYNFDLMNTGTGSSLTSFDGSPTKFSLANAVVTLTTNGFEKTYVNNVVYSYTLNRIDHATGKIVFNVSYNGAQSSYEEQYFIKPSVTDLPTAFQSMLSSYNTTSTGLDNPLASGSPLYLFDNDSAHQRALVVDAAHQKLDVLYRDTYASNPGYVSYSKESFNLSVQNDRFLLDVADSYDTDSDADYVYELFAGNDNTWVVKKVYAEGSPYYASSSSFVEYSLFSQASATNPISSNISDVLAHYSVANPYQSSALFGELMRSTTGGYEFYGSSGLSKFVTDTGGIAWVPSQTEEVIGLTQNYNSTAGETYYDVVVKNGTSYQTYSFTQSATNSYQYVLLQSAATPLTSAQVALLEIKWTADLRGSGVPQHDLEALLTSPDGFAVYHFSNGVFAVTTQTSMGSNWWTVLQNADGSLWQPAQGTTPKALAYNPINDTVNYYYTENNVVKVVSFSSKDDLATAGTPNTMGNKGIAAAESYLGVDLDGDGRETVTVLNTWSVNNSYDPIYLVKTTDSANNPNNPIFGLVKDYTNDSINITAGQPLSSFMKLFKTNDGANAWTPGSTDLSVKGVQSIYTTSSSTSPSILTGYEVLLQSTSTKAFSMWSFGMDGNATTTAAQDVSKTKLYSFEQGVNQDLNGDGAIGTAWDVNITTASLIPTPQTVPSFTASEGWKIDGATLVFTSSTAGTVTTTDQTGATQTIPFTLNNGAIEFALGSTTASYKLLAGNADMMVIGTTNPNVAAAMNQDQNGPGVVMTVYKDTLTAQPLPTTGSLKLYTAKAANLGDKYSPVSISIDLANQEITFTDIWDVSNTTSFTVADNVITVDMSPSSTTPYGTSSMNSVDEMKLSVLGLVDGYYVTKSEKIHGYQQDSTTDTGITDIKAWFETVQNNTYYASNGSTYEPVPLDWTGNTANFTVGTQTYTVTYDAVANSIKFQSSPDYYDQYTLSNGVVMRTSHEFYTETWSTSAVYNYQFVAEYDDYFNAATTDDTFDLNANGGSDTVVFADSASSNGLDTINGFTFGDTAQSQDDLGQGDMLNLSYFLGSVGVADANSQETGVQGFAATATEEVDISSKVALVTGTGIDITSLFGQDKTFAALETSGGKAVVMTADSVNSTTANLYFVESNGTQLTATQVATMTNIGSLNALSNENFLFNQYL